MPVRFQLVIDCADRDRLARFWAAALGYQLASVPPSPAPWPTKGSPTTRSGMKDPEGNEFDIN